MERNNGKNKTFWDNLLKSKAVVKILSDKNLMKGLKIGGGIFVLWFLFTAVYPKQENSPDTEELKELKGLVYKARSSVDLVNGKTDPFVKELFIERESKKLGITSNAYRRLLNLQKSSSDILPDIKRDNFWSPVIWFYQDLAPSDRLKLTGGWFLWIFSVLPNLTILYVGWKFLQEIPQREKQEKYQAWLVIHSAHGQKSSGARIAALQDLVEQGESLYGLTLEKGADLGKAQLKGAWLHRANLENIDFFRANLEDANLYGANLEGSTFQKANLERSTLIKANLKFAKLIQTNLKGANLREANFEGADLCDVDFQGANLCEADLETAKNLTREQLKDTYLCLTKLPEHLKDLSNRNCEENKDEWLKNWRNTLKQQRKSLKYGNGKS